jgi:hypothetical protein
MKRQQQGDRSGVTIYPASVKKCILTTKAGQIDHSSKHTSNNKHSFLQKSIDTKYLPPLTTSNNTANTGTGDVILPTREELLPLTPKELSKLPSLSSLILHYQITGEMLASLLPRDDFPPWAHSTAPAPDATPKNGSKSKYVLPPLIAEFDSFNHQPPVVRIGGQLAAIEAQPLWFQDQQAVKQLEALVDNLQLELQAFLKRKCCCNNELFSDESGNSLSSPNEMDLTFRSNLPLVVEMGESAFRGVYSGLAQQLKDGDADNLQQLIEHLKLYPQDKVNKPRQSVSSLVGVYRLSALAKHKYDALCKEAADLSTHLRFVPVKLKHLLRSVCKSLLRPALASKNSCASTTGASSTEIEYDALTDVCRGTILCDDFSSMLMAVQHFHDYIRFVKDRFTNPTNGGWVDCMALIEVEGIICEVQFVMKRMMDARKTFGGHDAYSASREAREIMEQSAHKVPELQCALSVLEIGQTWDPEKGKTLFRNKQRAAGEFVALCALWRDCGGKDGLWLQECNDTWFKSGLDVSQWHGVRAMMERNCACDANKPCNCGSDMQEMHILDIFLEQSGLVGTLPSSNELSGLSHVLELQLGGNNFKSLPLTIATVREALPTMFPAKPHRKDRDALHAIFLATGGYVEPMSKDAQRLAYEASLPLLEDAKNALEGMSKVDLMEIKSFGSPPKNLLMILLAALQMLARVPTSKIGAMLEVNKNGKLKKEDWGWIRQKLLSNVNGFMQEMLSFSYDDMLDENVECVRSTLEDPLCSPDTLKKVALAGSVISVWLTNMVKFYDNVRGTQRSWKVIHGYENASVEEKKKGERGVEVDLPLQWYYGVSTHKYNSDEEEDLFGRVRYLNLQGNGLVGDLPITPILQFSHSLLRLYLGNNGLSGAIPSALGEMKVLDRLELQNNHFTGPIPLKSLSGSKLTWINVSGNKGLTSKRGTFCLENDQERIQEKTGMSSEFFVNSALILQAFEKKWVNQMLENLLRIDMAEEKEFATASAENK